jgi:hypothetical protein
MEISFRASHEAPSQFAPDGAMPYAQARQVPLRHLCFFAGKKLAMLGMSHRRSQG